MNLIDIYITEVGKHLPKKSRADIQEEIRSALQDMLDDRSQQSGKPVDEELTIEVLKEYGSPEKVAASYLPERYLIGPRLFPAFLKTIQIVAPIIGILALIGLSISLSQAELSPKNWFETILQAVAGFFNSIVIALGYIVLILAILERVSPDLKEKPTPWDPHSLAKISPPDRVTIGEPIAAIILNFAAIVIFNFYPQVVGASFGGGVTQTNIELAARLMHRQFLSFDLDGEEKRVTADLFSSTAAAFREQISEPFAAGDLADHDQHGLCIAETQLNAVCVLDANQPVLKALHGKSDGRAGGNRIH